MDLDGLKCFITYLPLDKEPLTRLSPVVTSVDDGRSRGLDMLWLGVGIRVTRVG